MRARAHPPAASWSYSARVLEERGRVSQGQQAQARPLLSATGDQTGPDEAPTLSTAACSGPGKAKLALSSWLGNGCLHCSYFERDLAADRALRVLTSTGFPLTHSTGSTAEHSFRLLLCRLATAAAAVYVKALGSAFQRCSALGFSEAFDLMLRWWPGSNESLLWPTGCGREARCRLKAAASETGRIGRSRSTWHHSCKPSGRPLLRC